MKDEREDPREVAFNGLREASTRAGVVPTLFDWFLAGTHYANRQAAGGVAKEGWKHVRVALQLLESETASIGLTIGTQSAIAELQRALRDGATASPPPPSTGVSSGGQQALIEHIAQQWDDCTFDTPGEAINIGEAIRAAAKRYLGSQGECAASGAEGVSLRLLTDAEAGYCECNSFDATAREIQREFCKANGLTVPDTKEGGNV